MHPLTVVFWILFGSAAVFIAWSFIRMFFPRRWERGDFPASRPQPPVGQPPVRPKASGDADSLGVLAGVESVGAVASASGTDLSSGDTSAVDLGGGDSSGTDSGGGDFSGGGGDYGGGGGSGGW